MNTPKEEFEILISGYLDNELSEPDRRTFEARLDTDPAFRREFDAMRALVAGTAAACRVAEPPGEVWDTFLDTIYNRIERRAAWTLIVAGLGLVAMCLIFLYFTMPWGPWWMKAVCVVPMSGFALLFFSVFRQQRAAAKTDRYRKEVRR